MILKLRQRKLRDGDLFRLFGGISELTRSIAVGGLIRFKSDKGRYLWEVRFIDSKYFMNDCYLARYR